MARMRPNWFVGLPIEAGEWFEAIPPPPRAVRRFAASDLHVTVAFLGGAEGSAARRAFEHGVRWPRVPLEVTLGGVRAFGARRKPSALSAVLAEGAPRVSDAIAAVRGEMLDAAGARPDRRPPLPHVTVSRIGRKASSDERQAALAWASALDLGRPRIVLDRIALYTWAADRRMRLFEIVDERRVDGRAAGRPS